MDIPEPEVDRAQKDLNLHLDTLRREIGALRQELIESGQVESSPADDSYRLATQVDLLIGKFQRLQESFGPEDMPTAGRDSL